MNNLLVSIFGIIIFSSILTIIAKFFDIQLIYYLPFMIWINAIFILNMFLDKQTNNVFMSEITK